MEILDGGTVTSTNGYIDYKSTVTVDGAGSNWNNSSSLYVGYTKNGTLNISSGGIVTSAGGRIDYNSSMTVDGAGSKWTGSGGVNVGYSGTGTLNITNGGAVSDGGYCIGYNSGAVGNVKVDGAGSTWTNSTSSTYVGRSGSGTLNITAGGVVTNGTPTLDTILAPMAL